MTDLRGVQLEVGQTVVVIRPRYGTVTTYEAIVKAIGQYKVTLDRRRYPDSPCTSVLPNRVVIK